MTKDQIKQELSYSLCIILIIFLIGILSSCTKQTTTITPSISKSGTYVLQNNTGNFERDTVFITMGLANLISNPSRYGYTNDLIGIALNGSTFVFPYHIGNKYPTFWVKGSGYFTNDGMVLDWESAHIDSSVHKTFHSNYLKL